jgi:hypothetical protein
MLRLQARGEAVDDPQGRGFKVGPQGKGFDAQLGLGAIV